MRRALRQGTYVANDGAKEGARYAGIATVWALIGSAVAAFWWLDFADNYPSNFDSKL